MKEAQEKMQIALQNISIHKPIVPIIANVSANVVEDHFEIKNFFITTHDKFSLCDPTDGIVNMHFTILTEEDKLLRELENLNKNLKY
jgi:hypothetical protein